jgi:hypothetical protein
MLSDRSRQFQQICDDLTPGGPQANARYRLMSGLSHPSTFLVDHYFDQIDETPYVGMLVEPRNPPPAPGPRLRPPRWFGPVKPLIALMRNMRVANILRQSANALGIQQVLRPVHRSKGIERRLSGAAADIA